MKCQACGAAIEACEFCEGPDCPAAICYSCLRKALDENRSNFRDEDD